MLVILPSEQIVSILSPFFKVEIEIGLPSFKVKEYPRLKASSGEILLIFCSNRSKFDNFFEIENLTAFEIESCFDVMVRNVSFASRFAEICRR